MQNNEVESGEPQRCPTIPRELQFTARSFPDREYANAAIYKLHSVLAEISQFIDLSQLDGVTIAFDYDEALAQLDRGYQTTHKLAATKDVAIGVAMAPRVIRAGVVKTHLVLNAEYALSILEEPGEETEGFWQSLHLVAHECAHVEVTSAFDKSFPGFLLRKRHENMSDDMRWQVILAAWEEYAVCRIAGSIGYDPTNDYLETLIDVLCNTRKRCFEMIKAYRIHGDVAQIAGEVYGKLGDLLKYSSYFLGSAAAQNTPQVHPVILTSQGDFAWFSPFYSQLITVHEALWNDFGKWSDMGVFEKIGDLLEEMARSVGVSASRQSDGSVYFDIPYRPESMPDIP